MKYKGKHMLDAEPPQYCAGKRSYDKKTATTAKNYRWNQDHVELRIYNCFTCSHWHLTSSVFKPIKKKKIIK